MTGKSPEDSYHQQIAKLHLLSTQLLKKRTLFAWLRFIVFVLTLALSYQVFIAAGLYGFIPVIIGLGILLFLVSLDINNNEKISNTKSLITINENELRHLKNDFNHRYDGSGFLQGEHDFAADLDLFGKSSVYQWANRCHTEQGRKQLAYDFLHPLDVPLIMERHQAVSELSEMPEWRQQFEAFAIKTSISTKTQVKTSDWLKEKETHFSGSLWKAIVNVYSILTVASLIAVIAGYIPATIFSTLYVGYLIFSLLLSSSTIKPYVKLTGIVKEISTLQQMVNWIESKNFKSGSIEMLKKKGCPGEGNASGEIKELKAILDRFDTRLNIAGLLFLNSFLLWDVRQMISLNKWRNKNRDIVDNWFAMVSEMEVLCSLASIRFNNPQWCYPRFVSHHFTLNIVQAGHPLITEHQRVNNDFSLEGTGKIALVTGSNMAGKSTFLRTLGVNIVLAQCGAPVCADGMTISPVKLMSSMRIADNLAENTSTFYAELKKLKKIIDAVNRDEKVFILLDEILRGTNSLDRHTGSSALIAQFIRKKAVAVIATHDLQLARLQDQYPSALINYHFDVQVEGEELYFDYKLKEDICTSMNASLLMKKIGIEMNDSYMR